MITMTNNDTGIAKQKKKHCNGSALQKIQAYMVMTSAYKVINDNFIRR